MRIPGRIFTTVPADEIEQLRAENAELRHRIVVAEAEIDQLRTESVQRRAEVRALTADIPTVLSRRQVLHELVGDAVRHPDKAGVAKRAARKLGRALRKAWRKLTQGE